KTQPGPPGEYLDAVSGAHAFHLLIFEVDDEPRVLSHDHPARAPGLSGNDYRIVSEVREIMQRVIFLRVSRMNTHRRFEVVSPPTKTRATGTGVVDDARGTNGDERLAVGLEAVWPSRHSGRCDHAGHGHLDETVTVRSQHAGVPPDARRPW